MRLHGLVSTSTTSFDGRQYNIPPDRREEMRQPTGPPMPAVVAHGGSGPRPPLTGRDGGLELAYRLPCTGQTEHTLRRPRNDGIDS